MTKIERRAVEFRQTSPGVIEGTLIPYGRSSMIAGLFSETFEPGSIKYGSVIANRQHDRARPLARLGHGLTLEDGATELRASIRLPDTTEGRDTRALIEAGVLTGLSAEFRTVREDWPSPTERVIAEAELFGIGVVDDPAHDGAVIEEVRARLAASPPARRRRVWL